MTPPTDRTGPATTRRTAGPSRSAPARPDDRAAMNEQTGNELDVDGLLADRRTSIVICCGAGGVGKTTMSAGLAVRAADAGRRVVVLTIDPARRLAQSLGLGELDNTPRPVAGIDESAGGSLDAMMLDMKRTFDEVVLSQAPPERARQILSNPFYQALSSSFSGTQEYMAMEKLGQLHAQATSEGRWDLIVVDTPPARSALDFLDAPQHLATLLDGRFLRTLLAPARGPLRLMSAGVNLMMSVMNRILGGQILRDVQTFATAFETLFGGFRQRAERTRRLLGSPAARFVVVAAPERDPLREAAFFVDRLRAERMPLAGVVVNRVHESRADLSAERAIALAEELEAAATDGGPISPEVAALWLHAARMRTVRREQLLLERFATPRPDLAIRTVPTLATDVTDLAELREVGRLLGRG